MDNIVTINNIDYTIDIKPADHYNIILDSHNPEGQKGDTGNGISSIEKTSTSGLVDTYTITFTDGNETTFDVTNGSSIDTIEKTSTVGLVDTYTITLTNGDTSTFTVTNGKDGTDGTDGQDGADATINGVNALTLTANYGLTLTQSGSTANISGKEITDVVDGISAVIPAEASESNKLADKAYVGSQIGNGTITINQGGSFKGTFTTNQSGNTTINLDAGGGGGGGAVDSVNGQTGTVVLTASDVGALPDSTTIPTKTSDLNNDSGFITSSALTDYVTTNTAQDVTASKTFTQPVVIQNGAGTGSLIFGGDVNAGTSTANTRKLGRINSPTLANPSLSATLLGWDTSGDINSPVTNNDKDAVCFGGMKKILNCTSPMSMTFCVTDTRDATSADKKVYALAMDSNSAIFGVQPKYNGTNLATTSDIKDATLTITQGGANKGTFSANASSNKTIPLDAGLPSQTGNNGKFLTTDGSTASWASVSSGGGTWGSITGTLSDQTDLQDALDDKIDISDCATIYPVITEYVNGTEGYRIWSSGYCEQWGVIAGGLGSSGTIALLKEFADMNYWAIGVIRSTAYIGEVEPSTTSALYWAKSNGASILNWKASGYLKAGEY